MSDSAVNSPAGWRSSRQSSAKRSCRKGQRGPLDSGPAAPGPWHCISRRAQSKTPGGRLQLKHKGEIGLKDMKLALKITVSGLDKKQQCVGRNTYE